MPAPTMPDFAFKSAYTISDNSITPNNASLFDPFSPPTAQPVTSSISKPKEEVKRKIEPEYVYEDEYDVEPEPVSLSKNNKNNNNKSKSNTKSPYDNTFHSKREDLPIRYTTNRMMICVHSLMFF